MKKTIFRVLFLIVLVLPAYLTFFANRNQIRSAPVTDLKDQMSNAQLSFFGRLVSANGSIIKIATGANPSRLTGNLSTGDTLAIANSATTSLIYTIKNVDNVDTIEIGSNIGTTIASSYVVATRSAIHTVTFTPQTSVAGEKWQFLIKATNRPGESANDGIPDQTGFDIGSTTASSGTNGLGTRLKAADVTCPLSGTASVGTTVVITSGVNVGSTGVYHVIECSSATPSTIGTPITMTIGKALASGSQLINPSPGITHVVGQANSDSDTYTYAIRQLDGAGNIIDTTFGKLAATENVRVTAIVDPTITFIVSNTGSVTIGTSRCSSPLGNGAPDTTATSVSFGPLVLGSYNNLSQQLSCTTNSQNGYVIQAFENRPMTMLGDTTTLPDTTCNATGCNSTTPKAWTAYTTSGFGYALEGISINGATLGIPTAGQYKAFGVGEAAAQPILSRTTTPAGTDSIYVCYRAVASTTQQAGTYENSVNYIATATF